MPGTRMRDSLEGGESSRLGTWAVGKVTGEDQRGKEEGGRFQFYGQDQDSTPGPGIGDKRAGFPTQIPPLIRKTAMPPTGRATEEEGETLRRWRNSPRRGMKPETCSAKPWTHTCCPCPPRDGKNVESGQSEGLRRKNGKRGGVPRGPGRERRWGLGSTPRHAESSKAREPQGAAWAEVEEAGHQQAEASRPARECRGGRGRRPTHRPAGGTTGQSGPFQHRPWEVARPCRRDGISWGLRGRVGGDTRPAGQRGKRRERRQNYPLPREQPAAGGEDVQRDSVHQGSSDENAGDPGKELQRSGPCPGLELQQRIRANPKFSFRFLWICSVASKCCLQIQKQKESQIPRGAGPQGRGEEGQVSPAASRKGGQCRLCRSRPRPPLWMGPEHVATSRDRGRHAADRAFLQTVFVFLDYNVPLCSHVIGFGGGPGAPAAASLGPLFHGRLTTMIVATTSPSEPPRRCK